MTPPDPHRAPAVPGTIARTVTVVVPVRSFTDGFTRLRLMLAAGSRVRLARALAERAVAAAQDAGAERVLVVTGSAEVERWAAATGVTALHQTTTGLNAAVAAAEEVIADGSSRLIVHADLPLLSGVALAPLVDAARTGAVIAPSQDGGTSVFGGPRPVAARYGPGSFHAHLATTPSARVFVDHRLAIDIDTDRHLRAAVQLRGGEWLHELLGSGA